MGGCKYVDRNQWDYFTKGLTILFIYFSYERIFEWFFLQLVIKHTHSCPNRPHISCYSLLNNYEFFKVCKFCQILDFILKIYHNIKWSQNMLTILDFFSYIKNYNFVLDVMHITPHLHVVKDFSKTINLINTLNFIFFFSYILSCECFLNLGSRLLSSIFFYHKIFVITIVLYLVIFKN
jgi:hypothetical protein